VHVVPERAAVQLPPFTSRTAVRRALVKVVLGQARLVDLACRRENPSPVGALEASETVIVCESRAVAVAPRRGWQGRQSLSIT
jgi:hypothetical protein